MQKHLVSLLILVLSLGVVNGQEARPFTYKFLETDAPLSKSVVQFSANAASGATGFSWDFGQGGATSTEQNPTFEYNIGGGSQFTVTLTYSGLTTPLSQEIEVNPAFFVVVPDQSLGNTANLRKILRSAFYIAQNEPAQLGNMRFRWATFTGFEPTNYSFPLNSDEDFPNVYHTFSSGGDYTATLEVYNVNSPADVAQFTKTFTIEPVLEFDNLPNIITPNNDGVNDFFLIEAAGESRISFKVFSRTGAVVYENEAKVIKWDGKNYYGQDLPDGIYYYIITDLEGVYKTAKGFFYIYR